MGIRILFIITMLVSCVNLAFGEKWVHISGKWSVDEINNKKYLVENKVSSYRWGYSEINNHNSIISKEIFKKYTNIKFTLKVQQPLEKDIIIMFLFAFKNPLDFYAFRFVGKDKMISNIQLINSKIKNKSMGVQSKWNFSISELVNKDINFEFNKDNNVEIKLLNRKILLYLNNKITIDMPTDDVLDNGRIGFSSSNVRILIGDVKLYSGKGIIFEDDFVNSSVKQFNMEKRRVPDK